jgi:hypothetical protein
MTNRAHRTSAIALALALAASAAALAAGPLKGKTYEGGAPSSGVDSEGHHHRTHASGHIVIHVASSGKSVTVRFSGSSPVFYCNTEQRVHSQSTKPASVSSGGTFTARIAERFKPGPGASSITQVVTGRFSGRTLRGTIHTRTEPICSGVANFSATAR